jgi:hypothetical protein
MDAADDGRRDILNNKHTSVLEKALFRAEGWAEKLLVIVLPNKILYLLRRYLYHGILSNLSRTHEMDTRRRVKEENTRYRTGRKRERNLI